MGSVLQIVGAAAITVGLGLFSFPVAVIVGGLFLFVAGLAVSK